MEHEKIKKMSIPVFSLRTPYTKEIANAAALDHRSQTAYINILIEKDLKERGLLK